MNYHEWDYSHKNWIPEDTNKNIHAFMKESSVEDILTFMNWISSHHEDFRFSFRNILFSRLFEFKHFSIMDNLLEKKEFFFDEKIATSCSFNLGIRFCETSLLYWVDKVKNLDYHAQSGVYKKFWEEFLSFQFQRNEEFYNNLPHLNIVFDKIPFYIPSEYDMVSSYLMKSREGFLKNTFPGLKNEYQSILLQQLAMLCGTYYPESTSIFKEEFQKYPDMFPIFEKVVFYNKLQSELSKSTDVSDLSKKHKI